MVNMWENIKALWSEIIMFITAVFASAIDFLKDFFFWVLDNLFGAVIYVFDAIQFSFESLNPTAYISAIPEETRSMMVATGFNDAISIIVAALVIRFFLQVIPFVRFGS